MEHDLAPAAETPETDSRRPGGDPAGPPCSADALAASPKAAADPGTRCAAMLRNGGPCSYPSKGEHPHHGPLCGVHMRSLSAVKECCICLGDANPRQCKELSCGHTFHRRCINKWFCRGSLTCPMCRAVCLEELHSTHNRLSARVRHMLRVLPVPRGVCFAVYMLGLMNAPTVVDALALSPAEQQLITEVAYQSFTQDHFFVHMRQLGL